MPSSDSDKFHYWKRAQSCIAQGALTNSKNPHMHVFGVYPTHINRGDGAYVVDHNNQRYLDYICGLGVNLFGYGFRRHVDAVTNSLPNGFSHSLPTHHELDCAEALKEIFHFTEKWKFLLSGSEACSAAIRIARAYTGRDLVLSEGYHGHNDDFISLSSPASGIPKRTSIRPLAERDTVDMGSVAAIIIEPVVDEFNPERISYLNELRETCTKHGILLIYDEVITSFRFKNHSVASATGIIPDLFIIGKASAAGLPFAGVGGSAKVMDCDYFVSTTYAGYIQGHIACKATIDTLLRISEFKIDRLWEAGEAFIDKFNRMTEGYVTLKAYPTRGVFQGEALNKALLFQEACKAGILLCNSWFYSFPLIENDKFFFSFLADFMARTKLGTIQLEGNLPVSPFAQRIRDDDAAKKDRRKSKAAS